MSELDVRDQVSQPETIVQDYDLDASPQQVWRALTEPELLAAWLGPNDIRAEVGQRFHVEAAPGTDTAVECEVLEVDPHRVLTYSWREERASGPALDSEVTWILTPRFDGGTHLRLVQDGFSLSGGRVLAMAGARLSRAVAWRIPRRLADAFRLAA